VPFAVPPATASLGALHGIAARAPLGVRADVGISPVQLTPSQHHRAWDATLSASYERDDRYHSAWGAVAAAGPILYPWGHDVGDSVTNRLSPQLVTRWTTTGYGLYARVELERCDFLSGVQSGKDIGFVASGEAAIGGYLEAGHQFGEVDQWSVTIGVVLRVPAAAGVMVVTPK
jgi:hypothetical protein